MLLKFSFILLFLFAEIALGIYSMLYSDNLLAKFLFFILSAILICIAVIKGVNKILPSEEK
ncbi:hypothetical protein FKR84_03655 [Haloflavibacter putidus]|uniref:Uncharacterized protein n=1 Tax=Haloflavibacter putidus TaxID=2576776 RepID=A0A507ZTH7_9FLAO|nr:hypothetical protein FKR84_03655 [Haloflavibacter putidus]